MYQPRGLWPPLCVLALALLAPPARAQLPFFRNEAAEKRSRSHAPLPLLEGEGLDPEVIFAQRLKRAHAQKLLTEKLMQEILKDPAKYSELARQLAGKDPSKIDPND